MREVPVPGDRQDVITKDNVVVTVNATIFTQVVDAKQALFSVKNFDIAIDALARTALRSVIGTMTLDEALSERERINTDVQEQMEIVTDKWGIRISRIEIVEIAPPPQILAGPGAAEAGRPGEAGPDPPVGGPAAVGHQHRRGRRAGGGPRGRGSSARPRSCGPRATGRPRSSRREGRVAGDRHRLRGDQEGRPRSDAASPSCSSTTLGKFADSDNAKIVVPYESVGLLGAAQALRGVLSEVPSGNGVSPSKV